MKVIHWPRCAGKTTELIRMSAETGYRIVTATEFEAQNVYRDAKSNGLEIPKPISFWWLVNRDKASPGREYPKDAGYLIDNIDVCLNELLCGNGFHGPVKAITVSKACHKQNNKMGVQKDTDYCTDNCYMCRLNPDNKKGA